MRILATLQEADSGSATLGEIDVLTRKDEVRKTLGYHCYQERFNETR
jgi:ABC-type multidrug transport system ATPase subunit